MNRSCLVLMILWISQPVWAGAAATYAKQGMVVSQNRIASAVGVAVLRDGGSAVDAAIATAFALAVTHPAAGNIGGGGFLVHREADGTAVAFDFRELAPANSTVDMWLVDGKYDRLRHHRSHLAVGVPGTVAGLHLAWTKQGRLPWARLVRPSMELAREGIDVTEELATSLRLALPKMRPYQASLDQFSNQGKPFRPGDRLIQIDLGDSLQRIAERGPAGFYAGETAHLVAAEMRRGGGIITTEDLAAYEPKIRQPVHGTYRGHEIISMPPPSSGGVALIEILNLLEGFDLRASGFGSARNFHLYGESMRRAFEDRARFLGDPDFNPEMPLTRLTSKKYASELRKTIDLEHASSSKPKEFQWNYESAETTHLSVVDKDRNAVALTYTLEESYGSGIVVPGAGFLLNNEMGDFNPGPGLTDHKGLIGTPPNLTAPRKRMLSSMTPTIVAHQGKLRMVTGSPGGRTIINTVAQTILNVIDFGMNAQEAVDAGRIHHQWLPDQLFHEEFAIAPDASWILRGMGHQLSEVGRQGAAQVIIYDPGQDCLSGGNDRRVADGAAVGY